MLICGDSLEVMKGMESESVDLVVTSPPYNLRNTTGGYLKSKNESDIRYPRLLIRTGYDGNDDCLPHEEYVEWQRNCLSEMLRLLKPTGAIFYNHKWRVQGGLIQDRADIVDDFPVRQIIIWVQNGGFNYNPHYFIPTYEVIYLITKKDYRISDNGMTDVWRIPRESKNSHPAPFPVALPERCIRASYGEIVLDPFIGSGTTAVAAVRCGWDYIGIDSSQKYIDMAEERIRNTSKVMI